MVANLARHFYFIFLTILSLIEIISWKGYASILLLTAIIFQLILVLYLNRRRFNLLHPIFFLFITTNLSVLARSYVMVYSDSQESISFLMLDLSYSKFIIGSLWIIVCMIFFLIGYRYHDTKNPSFAQKSLYSWQTNKFWIIMSFLTLISLIGVYIFITEIGIQSINAIFENASKKRYVKLEDQKYATSLGYLRLIASFSSLAVYFMLIKRFSTGIKFNFYGLFVLLVALFTSLFFSFFVSSRTSILTLLLNCGIIFYAFGKLNVRLIAIGFASMAMVFSSMSIMRNQSLEIGYIESFEKLVVNRNLLSISNAGIILDRIPENLPFAFGESFIRWMYAPIPRAWWDDKPAVSNAKDIAQYIFGIEGQSGVPPGIIVETYCNFGFLGFIIMLPFGLAFGLIFKKIEINRNQLINPVSLLFYILITVNLATLFFGGSVSQSVIDILQTIIPAFLIIKLVLRKVVQEQQNEYA